MPKIIPYHTLFAFCVSVFEKTGMSLSQAETASRVLLSADLRGVDSHGIARLGGYVRLWMAGRMNPAAEPELIHETPSTAVVDGHQGSGLITAPFAMEVAIHKAEKAGTGWVAVQNSSHFGIAGIHAMMALEKDMIGIAMTNASPLVAPTFSKSRMLGTNPIAMAIPAGKQPAFVADFATTTAANGKLEIMQRLKKPVPEGWVQTESGAASTDPHILKSGGAMLPLGSDREHSSHKGFMLGSMVDILCGVLSGANYGKYVPPFPAYVPMPAFMPGKGIGHFLGAIRIDAFRTADEFKMEMDQWITDMRNAEPIDPNQKVIIPGDPERQMEAQRMESGIPIIPGVWNDLHELGEKLGVEKIPD